LNLHLERDDYKSAKGLRELKKELKAEKGETRRDSDQELETVEQAQSQQVSLPAPKRMPLPGGFHTGDRVASLVSRKRFGTVVLESGHEGIIASLALGMYSGGDDDVRLLVQFQAGHDWRLPLRQLCAASDYNAVKASPLPGGHSWGARVRSLVTYLNPPGGKKEVWLGDCGTVLGPGQTKSKIAVRFDDGRGEWNIWPSTLCSADGFNDAVKQRLAGGFGRGDRVTSKGNNQGSRSAEKGAGTLNKPQLQDGEEGTVVGPGHAAGWVLVHFDSDERVWSLKPTQLRAQASCI
jgi:hypothetical protein